MLAIALATCNGRNFLQEQIDSIRAQTLSDWTLLVSDDRSDDGTFELLCQLAKAEPRLELLPQPAERLGATANFGRLLAHAREIGAEYVALCDQDDIWFADKLETQWNRMKSIESATGAPKPVLVHTDAEIVDTARNPVAASRHTYIGSKGHERSHQSELSHLLMHSYVQGCTVMMNRPLLDLVVPLPDSAAYHDWWCALCAAAAGTIDYIDRPTLQYRQHGKNCVGAQHYGLASIARRIVSERRTWQNGMASFIKSIEQVSALRERLQQRGLSHTAHGELVERYCSVLQNETSRVRSVWKLHRSGIPATDGLRKLVSYARVMMLPKRVQRRLSSTNCQLAAASHDGAGSPAKSASDPSFAVSATLQAR